jgi:hypothetical protein
VRGSRNDIWRTSEIGTKRTSGDVRYLVANRGKADVAQTARISVAFDPEADIWT